MNRPCLSPRSNAPHRQAPTASARAALLFVLVLLAQAGLTARADAHLSIIRQGIESLGAREDGDQFGAAVATGDFNGDGYDDLATGAPTEDVSFFANAGSVVISRGSEFGLTHVGAVYLTATSIGGASSTDAEFGYALASADFNHDGYDDLVIGAPGETVSGHPDAGRIYMMKGSASGLVYFGSSTQTGVGETPEDGDRWGQSLAAGNFNGDAAPLMDLAVGSPGEGNGSGLIGQYIGSTIFFLLGSTTTFRVVDFGGLGVAGDNFGYTLAAGNLFGDTRDDLAVAAPNRTTSGQSFAGAVYLLRGTSTGLALSGFTSLTAAAFDAAQTVGGFGTGLAAGRFFGGSFDALAVGEPGRNLLSRTSTGRVLVFRGGSAGLGSAIQVTQASIGGTSLSNEHFGWSLAAGTFQDDVASVDDLGIGWPAEIGSPAGTDIGAVAVVYGGTNGPSGAYGWDAYDQGGLNDYRSSGDRLGAAVAFGRFDASNKDACVVGAPGEDNGVGQVHIIAPWRQRFGLTCRNALVTDCEGNLVFTLRPFDKVYIASTTKAMTTLLAAERSVLPFNDPKHISLNAEYTTPNWVSWQIPGSQVPLFEGEVMTLRELMWTCLFMSGNDAAFAIADLCEGSGGPNTSVPAFIQAMNDKAAALGMTGTHFHNPAGLDNEPVGPELGEHYSTPYDMMLLSRAAMNNPIVREIVGSTEFTMTRRNATGYSEETTFENIFSGVLTNNIQPLNGIKGGRTGLAKSTGLFSVTGPGLGDALITTFFTDTDNGGNYIGDAAHLAEVGLAECNFTFTSTAPHFENVYLGEFNSCLDCVAGRGLEATWGPPGDRTFLMARTAGVGALHARLELEHQAEMQLAGGDAVPLGLSPFKGHGPVVLRNLSNSTQTLQVLPSAGGTATQHTIPPQGYVTLPAWTSPTQLGSFTLNITNMSTNRLPEPFQVEIPFTVDVTLNPPTPFAGGQVPVTLLRDAALDADAVFLHVRGQDATGGGRLTVVVKEPGAVSGVSESPIGGVTEAPLARLVAGPNPSSAAVRLSFDLMRTGRVGAQLFDAQGRRVRVIEPILLEAGAGAFEWDGRDDTGHPVAHGLYFARVTLDDRPVASIKLMRLE